MGLQRPCELARGPWRGVWAWGAAPEPHVSGPSLVQVLRSLNKTYQNLKRKPVAVDLDPKAVTCDELFGIIPCVDVCEYSLPVSECSQTWMSMCGYKGHVRVG